MTHSRVLLVAGLFSIAAAGQAQATPLGLTLVGPPDIMSDFISVSHTAGGGPSNFAASGFAETLDDDGIGSPWAIDGGTFDITATISDSGVASEGTFSIGGTVAGLGFSSGTLLTGTLAAFGFPDAPAQTLEFVFNITGGDAIGLYSPFGGQVGVLLHQTGFGGSFASSFDNLFFSIPGTGTGTSDAAPIPAPVPAPPAVLLGVMGLAIARRTRRRPA